ncbi:cupin domain-containing protein, partial [Escherichia coli]|nr:cupin domain-containing protein [Escherichia coli]
YRSELLLLDPLSDVLSLLRPKSAISAGLDAGGDWAIRFPPHEGIKFNAVMRGSCWVQVEGESEPQRIEAGDCFLLTRGRPFQFATDLSLPAIDSPSIYDRAVDGIATCNGGGDFFLIGGRF